VKILLNVVLSSYLEVSVTASLLVTLRSSLFAYFFYNSCLSDFSTDNSRITYDVRSAERAGGKGQLIFRSPKNSYVRRPFGHCLYEQLHILAGRTCMPSSRRLYFKKLACEFVQCTSLNYCV
jgi:hypothetical protein